MRLVIDLQGAQAENRERGIGRYSLSLCRFLVRHRGEHDIFIALSDLFPETIAPLRATFEGLLPPDNIRVWTAPGPVCAAEPQNETRRRANELLREQFLVSLCPDVILVTHLFGGYSDHAVLSIGTLSAKTPTAVVFYDLIPLIHAPIYLKDSKCAQWYHDKVAHLRRTDLLLAISESSRQEAIDWLDCDDRQAVAISSAAEDYFCPAPVTETQRDHLAVTYGLVRPFVMYTGGIDRRKNIDALIMAYAQLPESLRQHHQLAFVCAVRQRDIDRLYSLARDAGLGEDELVLTGFIPDDDLLICYRACQLFVFPSWHEGFGLPVLEAMKCGKAVIAGDRTSLPEVVGRDDALFDPYDTRAIAQKIEQVLGDEAFRRDLERTGLARAKAFSWDATARKAWHALEDLDARQQSEEAGQKTGEKTAQRPRLAYLSPLPPEASGISDYSAELLPELTRFYRVEVIVAQEQLSDPWVRANCPVRDLAWFREHADGFDRILYHFGNSMFHSHMLALLRDHPGVVILHDFFLSHLMHSLDCEDEEKQVWAKALLESHGWPAVIARFQYQKIGDLLHSWPCNFPVLRDAIGVIVHSEYARQLGCRWYGDDAIDRRDVIPLPHAPARAIDKAEARRALGIADEAFVVCSFGYLSSEKMIHRLLDAWSSSALAQSKKCHLVLVGQNEGGRYGAFLEEKIRDSQAENPIEITGWVMIEKFHHWLAAADMAVQLRTKSRGESSRSVLGCMSYGVATIVNANGAMAELDQDSVWVLPDEFEDNQLVEALCSLWRSKERRDDLGQKARRVIAQHHDLGYCTARYIHSIERFYQNRADRGNRQSLMTALAPLLATSSLSLSERSDLAGCVTRNMPPRLRQRQVLIDVSILVQDDEELSVGFALRAIITQWLQAPPLGWRVVPVYSMTCGNSGYRQACRFASSLLDLPEDWTVDEPVEAYPGDVFFGLGLEMAQFPVLEGWHRRGVRVQFLLFDRLRSDSHEKLYCRWQDKLCRFDGVVCLSRTVTGERKDWQQVNDLKTTSAFSVWWFYPGLDFEDSVPRTRSPAPQRLTWGEPAQRLMALVIGEKQPDQTEFKQQSQT